MLSQMLKVSTEIRGKKKINYKIKSCEGFVSTSHMQNR